MTGPKIALLGQRVGHSWLVRVLRLLGGRARWVRWYGAVTRGDGRSSAAPASGRVSAVIESPRDRGRRQSGMAKRLRSRDHVDRALGTSWACLQRPPIWESRPSAPAQAPWHVRRAGDSSAPQYWATRQQ